MRSHRAVKLTPYLVVILLVLATPAHTLLAQAPEPDGSDNALFEAAIQGDLAAVHEFVANGVSVHDRNREGSTPLHLAALHNRVAVARFLLSKGAVMEAQLPMDDMRTPLHLAVGNGHTKMIRFLLAGGADVNADSGEGTALHYVVAQRLDVEIAKILVGGGANPSFGGMVGMTPLERAREYEYEELVAFFSGVVQSPRGMDGVAIMVSGTLPHREPGRFGVANLVDDEPSTAWCEGKPDDGIGEWIEFAFHEPRKLERLGIVVGYAKSGNTFRSNNRVKTVIVSMPNCDSFKVDLKDTHETQYVELPSEDETKSVVITIQEVYRGSRYRDTCISEITLNPAMK